MPLADALDRVYAIQHGISVEGHTALEVHEASLDLNRKLIPPAWVNGEVTATEVNYYGGNVESEFTLRMLAVIGAWRSDHVILARKWLEPVRDAFVTDEGLFEECERGIGFTWGTPAVGQISQWGGSFVVVDARLTMRFFEEHDIG